MESVYSFSFHLPLSFMNISIWILTNTKSVTIVISDGFIYVVIILSSSHFLYPHNFINRSINTLAILLILSFLFCSNISNTDATPHSALIRTSSPPLISCSNRTNFHTYSSFTTSQYFAQ